MEKKGEKCWLSGEIARFCSVLFGENRVFFRERRARGRVSEKRLGERDKGRGVSDARLLK